MMKAAFYTLGCKTNQFETQALERMMAAKGYETVPFDQKADLYVINTCSVTAVADKKSRNVIRRARALAPDGIIAVCGCSAQNSAEEDIRSCGADIILGADEKSRLPDMIEQFIKTQSYTIPEAIEFFDYMPAGSLFGHTRALLKVQDGCRNFCTYCIIPYLRNRLLSLPVEVAAEEAARLEKEGYREIVITGIEISSYGVDLPEKPTLLRLLEAVCNAAPNTRIRLGSLEPRTVTEKWAKTLSQYKNICPHFHLSLQSGCDRTLKDMGRRYNTQRYKEAVTYLRKYFPDCAVTTDLIVGFPGETDEDFSCTLDFLNDIKPAQVHIFPYSRRKGTKAYARPNQLTRAEKEQRAKKANALCRSLRAEYLSSFVGKTLTVLFEQEKDGVFEAYSTEYIPVSVRGENLHNRICDVYITKAYSDKLSGEIR